MAQEIADSTLLDTWASSGLIVEPDISKIIEGWQLGEQPPHEYMNWLQNTFGSKLNHILKNGVATWNNETEYLAGSSVQHNGNVWLCKTTNTNSEPTDANANWKRIITVESLADLSDDYVATTGAQTIAGVKTFSSSPIVPTPTTDMQVATKLYVDTNSFTIASTAEAQAGTDNTKAITPLRLREGLNATGDAPIYACRAWVNFNGTGTVAIRASGNVSSITDNGVGDYTVNFTTAMPDVNYSVCGTTSITPSAVGIFSSSVTDDFNKTINSINIGTFANGSMTDRTSVNMSIFR